MINPFDEILEKIDGLEQKFIAINSNTTSASIEIINRDELCRRLGITEPTVIRYEKKKKIPAIRIGSSVRYNWPAVVSALENEKA